MDQGRCIEQGAPRQLLGQPHSVFSQLAAESGAHDLTRAKGDSPGASDADSPAASAGGGAAQVADGSVEAGEGRRNRALGTGQSLKAGGDSVGGDGSGAEGNVADGGEALEDMPVASL